MVQKRTPVRVLGALAATLLAYAPIVVWLTWPLASHLATELPVTFPGLDFDALYSAWAMAHATVRLTTDPLHLAQANIYHPVAGTFFYGPTALGAVPLFAPTYLLTGNPVLATNLLLVLGLTSTAAATHEVVRRWTGRHAPAAAAALYVLSSGWLNLAFVPTAPHLAALTLFPVVVYLAARGPQSARGVLALALAVALQSLTEVVYVAPALFAPLGVLAALRLARGAQRRSGALLLASLAVALLLISPVLLGYAGVARSVGDLPSHSVWRIWGPPTALPAAWLDRLHAPGTNLPTVFFVAVGAVCALSRRRRGGSSGLDGMWSAGALWTAMGLLLSIDFEATLFSLPIVTPRQIVARWVPAVASLRAADRLGVAALFGEAILCGAAFAEIFALAERRWPRLGARRGAALAGIAVAAGLFFWLPEPNRYFQWSTKAPRTAPASFVAALRARPGPVAALPAGDRRSQRAGRFVIDNPAAAGAMFQSIAHRQPLLNGYASYFPEGFTERMALVDRLPDEAVLRQLVAQTGLRYVWVNLDGLAPEKRAQWQLLQLARFGGLRFVAEEGPELLFEVDLPN